MFKSIITRNNNFYTKMIYFFFIFVVILSLSDYVNTQSLKYSIQSNSKNNKEELSPEIINDLLYKCKDLKPLSTCDMCSLCQNGAMCQQKPTQKSLQLYNNNNYPFGFYQQPEYSFDLLKSLIDFKCYCVPGFTDTYCQKNVDECSSKPCSNNSTCIDGINKYECKCPAGYTGAHCEININECESSPCKHFGECIDLVDGYYCQCSPGYTGPTCDIDINECVNSPCMNNGRCLDLINTFECDCSNTGFEGNLCEKNIDDCVNVNCQHNSTCVDGINSFKCECHSGYDGKYCEIDIDECESSPCINGQGKCWQKSDKSKARSGFFDYSKAAGYWCECLPGFSGLNCEVKINECQSNPCGFNGKCIDLINQYTCSCYPGYTGKNCLQNINECNLMPCASNTKCIDLEPDYRSHLISIFGNQAKKLNFLQSNKTRNYAIDNYILDYNHQDSNSNGPDDDQFVYLDGYYCDCSDLNENLFKQTQNRDVTYAGQNCTLKLNACETLKHLCQHDSVCQSILSIKSTLNSTEQDIMCLCKPGYTGKYCQQETSFRLDGTYIVKHDFISSRSIHHQSDYPNYRFNLKFDFRINNFDSNQNFLPLIYFEKNYNDTSLDKLLYFQVTLHRQYLSIQNSDLDLEEKVAFYYTDTDLNKNIWHSIEFLFNNENQIHLTYAVKELHLSVTKIISIKPKRIGIFNGDPSSFTIGKFYEIATNRKYLSGACVRDVTLNGQYLFKNTNQFNKINEIKYGCNFISNQCIINPSSDSFSIEAERQHKPICLNNSTCVYRLYDYECIDCRLPYYGKNCQYESTKLAFFGIMPSKNSILEINSQLALYSSIKNSFKINFMLHRIHSESAEFDYEDFTFLSLKQQKTSNIKDKWTFYYLMSINKNGYITLAKIKNSNKNLDFTNTNSIKQIWSVSNQNVNLNQFTNAFAFKISLKLNENFIEIKINDTYLSRFELIDSSNYFRGEKFEIDTVKFTNFDTLFSKTSFLIYDLAINNNHYMFRNGIADSDIALFSTTKNTIKLVILDNNLNLLNEIDEGQNYSISSVINYSQSLTDFEVIEEMNTNEIYCRAKKIGDVSNESVYSIGNRNFSYLLPLIPANNNKRCFTSSYFKLKEMQSNFNIFSPKSQKFGTGFEKNITCKYINVANTTNLVSTCGLYSNIYRKVISKSNGLAIDKNKPNFNSYIKFLFDFTDISERHTINETSNSLINKQNFEHEKAQPFDFYSISFDLNLDASTINDSLIQSIDFRSNLFNLNTFDRVTLNRIFLFGLNFYAKKLSTFNNLNSELVHYEFEIVTSQEKVRSRTISFSKTKKLNVNVTFDTQSIELRIENKTDFLIRLTNKDQLEVYKHLLKAYGPFQLNITSEYASLIETKSSTSHFPSPRSPLPSNLVAIDYSNFVLVTRKRSNLASNVYFTYKTYDLINQTKTVSIYKSKINDLYFENELNSTNIEEDLTKNDLNPRIITATNTSNDCFLVTRIDVLTNQKLTDFYDCKCNSTNSLEISNCSYNFWSDEQIEHRSISKNGSQKHLKTIGCEDASEYACFNNGTCVDNDVTFGILKNHEVGHNCICTGSYTGNRCETFDPCLNNPCFSNSTCIPRVLNNDQISYECKCNPGFLGRNCTIRFDETCLAAPCMNGGTCLNVTSFEDTQKLSYQCMCTLGFKGKNCEEKIDYCKLYEPCSNGAHCINQDEAFPFYKCNCKKGWTGINCTQDIDECTQMRNKLVTPCSGHGQCINTRGSYNCVCNEYYYGNNCENIHICHHDTYEKRPCKNGAFCLVVGDNIADNKYECKCLYGYSGVNCAYQTCDNLPCKHNGRCEMVNATNYDCNCTGTGYAGLTCETLVNHTECNMDACFGNRTCDFMKCDCDTINCEPLRQQYKPKEFVYHLILWPLLAIMVTLLIILLSIFLMRVKKSRATRGTYSPSRHELQASRIEFNMDLKRPPEERLI